MVQNIEKIKARVYKYLIDFNEEEKRIDYILENPENGEVEVFVNDGIEEMKRLTLRLKYRFTDKWVVKRVWDVPKDIMYILNDEELNLLFEKESADNEWNHKGI